MVRALESRPEVPLLKPLVRNDAKSVSIVSLGCLHPIVKVQSAALHFFLDEDNEDESSDEEDDVCHQFFASIIYS